MSRPAPTIDPDPREAKLPVWAKGTIDLLRQKLAEAERRNTTLQQSLVDQSPSDKPVIEVDAWQVGTIPVPGNARVVFYRPGSTQRIEAIEAYVDSQSGNLTLMTNWGHLLVKPKASNVVVVATEER